MCAALLAGCSRDVGTYLSFDCSAQSWTKYHIAVTQRKEEEPTVSKDYYDTHSPAVRC